ncbi:MAG: hypothetical protein ABGW87_00020 [Sphingomonadaceae bacterium]
MRIGKGAIGNLAILQAVLLVTPATVASAQVGTLLGSSAGAFCKFKSRNRIEVRSSLPAYSDVGMLNRMTLRTLAEMSRSKGFDAFVTRREGCASLHLNGGSELGRSCTYKATMINLANVVSPIGEDEKLYEVAAIYSLTDQEASSYPRLTGIFERHNACVID